MKKDGKVKTFVKEHSKGIITATLAGGLLICGGVVGWKISGDVMRRWYMPVKRSGNIADALSNMIAVYPDKHCEYTGSLIGEFTPLDLGKLGEKMMNAGAPTNAVLTHFICVGPEVK